MIQQGRKVVVRKQLRFSVLIAIKFDRTDEMRGKYPSSHPPPLKIRGWRVKKSLFIGWLTFFPPTSSFYSSSSSFFLFLFFFFFSSFFYSSSASLPTVRLVFLFGGHHSHADYFCIHLCTCSNRSAHPHLPPATSSSCISHCRNQTSRQLPRRRRRRPHQPST